MERVEIPKPRDTAIVEVEVPLDLYMWLKKYNLQELLSNLRYECRSEEIKIVDNYVVCLKGVNTR